MKRRTKLLLMSFTLVVITIAGIGYRIYTVNKERLSLPTKHYCMGEWVDVGNTHLYDIEEYRQGYSVQVSSAHIMSSSNYVHIYGKKDSQSSIDGTPGDVLVLKYDIKNVNNTDGYIDAITQWAIGASKNYYLNIDNSVWSTRDPVMKESPVIKTKPNTEFSTYIPFSLQTEPFGKKMDADGRGRGKLNETKYELIIANGPVRQIIDIEVS